MNTIDPMMIDFPSNGHKTPGYLARPGDTTQTYPAIIVLQEWWGLVPHIKDVAERFAKAGFIALAPDLYHGQTASEPDEARKLVMELDRERVMTELEAAARYLQQLDGVGSTKVGIVGWCLGGAIAFGMATRSESIGATVGFYGRPPGEEEVAQIQAPVLGLFGELDQGIPPEAAHAFEEALTKHGIPHEIHVYPDAHHAFFNETRPIYHPEHATNAWQRTVGWFNRHLV